MQTFLPYADFRKTAKCLDYRRLGKQRIEAWQIYLALKQGEYKECPKCDGIGMLENISTEVPHYYNCKKCKGTGKIKTAWYNHPIVKMWKGYEHCLLLYGWYICQEWRTRGYKGQMWERFINEMNLKFHKKEIIYPKWLGNKKFHASHRSNLLRKDKKYYSKFNWKIKDNLPYLWIKEN